MSRTTISFNTDGEPEKQVKAIRTRHIVATLLERAYQRVGICVIHINMSGVQLIMHAAELHALTNIHPPIQVEYDLEHCWEYLRPANSSNGEV
jgi:hypothetical protein